MATRLKVLLPRDSSELDPHSLPQTPASQVRILELAGLASGTAGNEGYVPAFSVRSRAMAAGTIRKDRSVGKLQHGSV